MKSRKSRSILPLVTLVLPAITFADWTWTGNSTETTKYWSDPANWNGTDGTWYVNSSATVNFKDSITEISNPIAISGGTKESPIVFTADSEEYGLQMNSGAGNARLDSGYWNITGGYYRFSNDLVLNNDGKLTINGGQVNTMYWLAMGGTSEFTLADGAFSTAKDNGASNPLNGALNIGITDNADVKLYVTGGTLTSYGSANSGDIWQALMLGNANGAKATMVVSDNGEYTSPNDVTAGRAGNSTGAITVKDNGKFGVWTMNLANGSKSTATIDIQGNASMSLVGIMNGATTAGAKSDINVTGGSLVVNGDFYTALSGTGTLTVGGSTTKASVTTPNATWVSMTRNSDGDGTITLKQNGTLTCGFVEANNASASNNKFIFDGGTLCKNHGTGLNNGGFIIASDVNATISVTANGGTLDLQEYAAEIKAPITGVGTLTKKGSGTLTLSGGYFAGIAVADGSVTTPGGNTVNADESFFLVSKINQTTTTDVLDDKALWIEANGKVTLTGVELDFDAADEQKLFDVSAFRLLNETVATETDVSAYFTIDGATEAYKIIYKSGAVYAVANRTPNKWNGEGEGAWTEPLNWSEKVVPDEHSLVVFDGDAVVTCSGMGSDKRWLRLRLENDAIVEFKNTDDTSYPGWTIDSNSIEGNGTIILTHCGFYASTDVVIPSTISIVIQNSTSTTDNGYNCWLSAADGHSLTVGGAVEVKNFLSTDGTVTFNNDVTIDAGARLNISSGTTTFNAALTCLGSAVLEKGSSAAVVAGQSASFTAPTGDSHIDAAIAALFRVDTTVNVWRGGETGGDWGEKTNWRYGVPTSLNNAVFTSKASVSMSGAQEMNTLEVQNNSEVSLIRSSGDPSLRFKAMTGTGTLKLTHIGLVKIGDAESADIASTLKLDIQALNDNADLTDCWFSVDGTGVLNVYAPITGPGFVNFYDGTRLYGDNSQFTGRVYKGNVNARFMTPQSGFPNASRIDIHGNLYAWFESGELALGGNLTMTTYQEDHTSLKWLQHEILTKNNSESVTIVVGGGNGTVRLQGNNRKIDPWNHRAENQVPYNCAHGTIRKIGTGTMRCRMHGSYNLDIREGEVNMTDVFADRPLASIAVASGATVTGSAVCQTATLNPGAIVKQTVTGAGTTESPYTCPTLTVKGNVNVDGVKFGLEGDTSATTAENSLFTLLTAPSVTGTPVAEGSSIQNKIWKPKVSDNSVVMSLVKGFALFIF